MNMRILQAGILAVLAIIAGLLYSIRRQMTAPAAHPAVEAAQALPSPAVQPAVASPTLPASTAAPSTAPAAPAVAPAAPAAAQPATVAPQAVAPAPAPRATSSIPRRPAASSSISRAPAPASSAYPAPQPVASQQPSYESNQTYVPPPQPMVAVPPPAPAPPPVRSVTVPAGTAISVRLLDALSTEKNRAGDTFQATLEDPLIAEGVVVADRGANVMGRVVQAQQSGRVAGVAEMALEIDRIQTAGGEMQIASDTMMRKAETSHGKDAATAGAMAGIGAAIGAIAGGRRGAGIGAAGGGAAGAGTVMATRGKPVKFDPETRLTFRLRAPITVTADNARVRSAEYGNYDGPRPRSDEGRPRLQRRLEP